MKRFYQATLTYPINGKSHAGRSDVTFRSTDDRTAINYGKRMQTQLQFGQRHWLVYLVELTSDDCCEAKIKRVVLGRDPHGKD